jgi:hypothetical protein
MSPGLTRTVKLIVVAQRLYPSEQPMVAVSAPAQEEARSRVCPQLGDSRIG